MFQCSIMSNHYNFISNCIILIINIIIYLFIYSLMTTKTHGEYRCR